MGNSNSLSVFCDESHPVKHDGSDFFILGCAYAPTEYLEAIKAKIIFLKNKYGYQKDYEIKWSRINGKNLALVKDLISYVAEEENIFIRVWTVPNKKEEEYKFVLTHEKLYSSMYKNLLKFIFDNLPNKDIDLFFDERNTNSKTNADSIATHFSSCYKRNVKANIVSSIDEELVQIADLFIGATSYECTGLKTSNSKLEVIDLIKCKFGLKRLKIRTSINAIKYSSFVWDGRYGRLF